jgi:hypothetical protein
MYSRFIKLNGYPLVHHPLPEVNNYRINEITDKKYHTVDTVHKCNRKIVDTRGIDSPNTQIHDHPLFWLGTSISIYSGGVELV